MGRHAAAVAALAFVAPAMYAPTFFRFKQISIAGSPDVAVAAVNNAGAIAGTYDDGERTHGFVLSGSGLTVLPSACPGTAQECPGSPMAMNDAGDVMGGFLFGMRYAFLWRDGAYVPGGGGVLGISGEPVMGLNNAGVEYFADYIGQGFYNLYVGKPGSLKMFTVSPGSFAMIRGLNGAGTVAGTVSTPDQVVFMRTGHHMTLILPPGATRAEGGYLNDRNQVAGTYADSAQAVHGFVYQDGAYTVFEAPSPASEMAVQAINNYGRVAGVFTDTASHLRRAFLFNGKKSSAFGHFPGDAEVRVRLNDAGIIILSATAQGSSVSFQVNCSGAGC